MTDLAKRLVLGVVAALCVLLSHFHVSSGADFSGQVVSVLDGDTIEVLNGHHADHIREAGRLRPRKVTLQTHGLDKYGWNLADVWLPDGTYVNHTLGKDGWCCGTGSMRRGIRCWKG